MSTRNITEIRRPAVSSINPATGELLREFDQHSEKEVESQTGSRGNERSMSTARPHFPSAPATWFVLPRYWKEKKIRLPGP